MPLSLLYFVFLFLVTWFPRLVKPDLDRLPRTPVIHTKYGHVQGRVITHEGIPGLQPVHVFKGIPYATPPVGSNR